MTRSTTTRIERLELTNFRMFARLTIELHPELTVLVAPNGCGKTTILDALAQALKPLADVLAGAPHRSLWQSGDVRRARAPDGRMAAVLPSLVSVDAEIVGRPVSWQQHRRTLLTHPSWSGARPLRNLATTLHDALIRSLEEPGVVPAEVPVLPVLVYHGSGRRWPPFLSGPLKPVLKDSGPLGAFEASFKVDNAFHLFQDWFFRHWFQVQADGDRTEPPVVRRRQQVAAVVRALNVALEPTGWRDPRWNVTDGHTLELSHSRFGTLPVNLMSDGIRGIVAIVGDLAMRCAMLNSHLGEHAAEQSPGIVLIDEVDLHLHPDWQQVVLGTLRASFPAVQLIVTTHSPQVVSTAHRESIRIIGPEGQVDVPDLQTRGVESAAVLAEVMGVDPVPPLDESRLVMDYQALIEQGQAGTPHAERMRQQVNEHFGPSHPVVLECERLVRWQSFKLAREARA